MPKIYTLDNVLTWLWGRVDYGGPGCWRWFGRRSDGRYGAVEWRTCSWKTHRLVWSLVFGPIPDGLNVLHRCDNPACVRPSHLFLGTQLDNVRDCIRKGRKVEPSRVVGEEHHAAKLTPETVRAIRRRYAAGGESQKALARAFGVHQVAIFNVVNRVTWRHVS